MRRHFTTFAAALLATGAQAQQSATPAASALTGAEPFAAGSLLQLTLSLLVVLVAVFGAGWMLRRLQRLSGGGSDALKIVSTLPVGTRERIVLVQAGNTQLLVGLTPGRIESLHVLDEPIEVGDEASAAAPRFAALLKSRGTT